MLPPNDTAGPARLLRRADANELGDSLLLPVTGHAVGFLLAGFGDGPAAYLLATPDQVDLQVRISGGVREYDLPRMSCTTRGPAIELALDRVHLYRFDTPCHDYLRFYLVCRTPDWVADFERNAIALAFDAASSGDWHLENSLSWCQGEADARAGRFRPGIGFELPEPLAWRLARPLFRQRGAEMLFEWEVVAPPSGERMAHALVRCATDRDGQVVRTDDMALLQLLRPENAAFAAHRA